ncbi:hypothetical protein [Microbacterium lacus]|uniref:hypothetical protein n=1 Tax=Microbacterium lacus TaxID=415217 RepID=UPI000C2C87CE|nr:hypothetical protein [Microbacterium lacus]
MNLLRAIGRASIWHSSAIPENEKKYRNLKRVWLPIYDVIAIIAGILAFVFGSRLLYRLLGPELVDTVGLVYSVVALVCLFGVAFPKLWAVEIAGKIILVGLVVGYIAAIMFYSTPAPNEPPPWFIVAMLAWGLPMALFRLSLLGEEQVTRHLKRLPRRAELSTA